MQARAQHAMAQESAPPKLRRKRPSPPPSPPRTPSASKVTASSSSPVSTSARQTSLWRASGKAVRCLPHDDPERLHMKGCKVLNCQRCAFGRGKWCWSKRLPVLASDASLTLDKQVIARGSWVEWQGDALGCIACRDVKLTARIGDLERHHKSKRHRNNVFNLLNVELSPSGFPLAGSPPAAEFLRLWDSLCDKNSPRHGAPGVCHARKAMRMAWCIAEGIKTLDRKVLQKSRVTCLLRDERNQRLMIRFRCLDHTGDRLRVRKGLLWQAKKFGTGSVNITTATAAAISKFATRNHGAPKT